MASSSKVQAGGRTIPVITLDSPPKSETTHVPHKKAMAPFREVPIHNESMIAKAPHGAYHEAENEDEDEDLETCLRKNSTRHHDVHIKTFWSRKSLDRVLTKGRILNELRAYRSAEPALFVGHTIADLADTIFGHHRKVFAILVLLERGPSIMAAIAEGLNDTHLPLFTQVHDIKHQLYRGSSSTSASQLVRCLSSPGWKTLEREGFFKYQRALSPEELALSHDGRTPQHKDFDDEAVLPFVNAEEKDHGGFGMVSKVELDPDCHNFHGVLDSIQTNDKFALKQLNNGEIVDFKREVKALMRFSGFDHPHMVTLLMTWTLDKRYYLLFPLAACDLEKYWRGNPQPVLDEGMATWMAKQMVGIASALEHIHDPHTQGSSLPVPSEEFGRHGDLKPENILLYESPNDERGIVVVADFGLAKLNSILSRTQTNTHTPFSPRYKAPECDILGAKVSRVYDIWTLGCVILEWICWIFEGDLTRNEFMESLFAPFPSGSQADMFFDMVHKPGGEYNVIVKPQVRQKFKQLHNHERCTQFFHDLLFLVEDEMMVIRVSDRSSSKAVHQKLKAMQMKMERDVEYFQKPCTTSQSAKLQYPLKANYKVTKRK